MKAGRLRHRVSLQKPATGRLPSGQPATGWIDVASVRAEVADVSGREMMDGGAELSSTTTRIWMRRYPPIAVYDVDDLEIVGVVICVINTLHRNVRAG